MDKFTDAYIEAMFWCSDDDEEIRDLGINELSAETLALIISDCENFQSDNAELLSEANSPEYNGHDFWLTRNGHGAGFWDRGLGEIGDKLTAACKTYGELNLYIGDDGLIYLA